MNIFVGPSVPLVEIGSQLTAMMGKDLVPVVNNGEETYELVAPSYLLTLGGHDLIDNKGIPFEQSPLQIALWATNVPDWKTSRKECLRIAGVIFEALKATGRYRLLLVRNVQELLQDYSPPR
ncbi:MAG: hypothetical protein ABIW19_16350 [Vicinamibacterales bacterium]